MNKKENTRPHRNLHLLFFIGVLLCSCQEELPDDIQHAYQTLPDHIDFNIHVKPILSDKCFACHGPDQNKLKAGLRLDLENRAYQTLASSKKAISKGSLKQSEVYHRIISNDDEYRMPPPEHNVELSDFEKAVLIKWIEEGAEYKPHWAFIKPSKPTIPLLANGEQMLNPIDNFILNKLEPLDAGLSQESGKELLLRRLSFDLTGLPPTINDITNFLKDKSEHAYEKQVDKLIASVHYGEKLATDWMDVARYSDTYGYQVDRYRDMSPWRDWVIQAFNKNMSYDQFITWQLAGDLLPNATRQQIIATGFNRLHSQNMEDGIIEEEYRVEHVSDRVAVLGDGILGLTLSCAKCHDHKYDPVSQKEYYEIFSFFNTINEKGQIAWDYSTPVPNLLLPTPEQTKQLQLLEQDIQDRIHHIETITQTEKEKIERWINAKSYKEISTTPPQGLIAHYPLDYSLKNTLQVNQQVKMAREFSKNEVPTFTDGLKKAALALDGDAWLDCTEVGIFRRSDSFSIGLWIYLPKELEEGVIFHKNKGSRLHSFRGYQLYLRDNKLEWYMARTWPENAIIQRTTTEIPSEEWIQLTVTYDGSSTAAGTAFFMNGELLDTQIEKDNLYKDIIFNDFVDIIYPKPIEPNLQVGARWRGTGIKNAKVDDILVYNRTLTPLEIIQIAQPNISIEQLIEEHPEHIENYYLSNVSKPYSEALDSLQIARTIYVDSMENVKEIMVMQEMETPRKSFVLNRGLYDDYGEEVYPNTPTSVMPMPADYPKNRLGLAQWVTDKNNPLTARVAVNRYWQMFFGRALVKSAQDFGNQGDMPSHPELLDWLAVEFMESGWDVKALLKLFVMSKTYRQSSMTTALLLEKDPENIWLTRGPSDRLTSEMIRDNALAASHLLNTKVGGESVYPYQPEALWSMNFDPYPQDTGDKLYRRSMYTMWRRTIPNPTLATFDQPERNACTVNRQKTNTPLQALVLLNDPTFVEAAKVIGENMARVKNLNESIQIAFLKITGKSANQKEINLLTSMHQKEYDIFKNNPEKSKGWLETGDYQIDPDLDKNLIAANAIVASVILNGDVTITKR